VNHRTRVVLAGWLVFYAVFFAAALALPSPMDALPLLAATAVTAVLTPVLHVQLAHFADGTTASEA
jgi:hypothetical protein